MIFNNNTENKKLVRYVQLYTNRDVENLEGVQPRKWSLAGKNVNGKRNTSVFL